MKTLEMLKGAVIATVAVVMTTGSATAMPITTPIALNPGDQYRLAFVASTPRDATSTNIADYNTFVTGLANAQAALAALGTTWKMIGSTSAVDARDNTETNPFNASHISVPIYLVNGTTKIADSNLDLWDGLLDAVLRSDEMGALLEASTHTGTQRNGIASIGPFGGPLGSASVALGISGNINATWIENGASPSTDSRSMYALSGVLTVPGGGNGSQVPEPGTIMMFGLGLAGLGYMRRRRAA